MVSSDFIHPFERKTVCAQHTLPFPPPLATHHVRPTPGCPRLEPAACRARAPGHTPTSDRHHSNLLPLTHRHRCHPRATLSSPLRTTDCSSRASSVASDVARRGARRRVLPRTASGGGHERRLRAVQRRADPARGRLHLQGGLCRAQLLLQLDVAPPPATTASTSPPPRSSPSSASRSTRSPCSP
jgi:hypothetical protein